MINGSLNQFLDTGWFTEATLFYHDYVYWCEAYYDTEKKSNIFFIDKWHAVNENNAYYHSIVDENGNLTYTRIYEDSDEDLDAIKRRFLTAPVFDGKSFWEIETEIAWLDESGDVVQ